MKAVTPLTISCEFFPPKTVEGVQQLCTSAISLEAIVPHFFSVTFGAAGATREGTLQMVKLLQAKTSTMIVPHIACLGLARLDLAAIIEEYRALGVKRLVVLRGDVPKDGQVLGDFQFASELVAFIREVSGDHFHIDVAAYPEIHPQAQSATDDVLNLARKYEAGANSAITQYFFNPDAYFHYLDECAKFNIFMPITPGIMPITQFNRLVRFSDNCGAEIPRWIRKRIEQYADDHNSIQAFGFEVVYKLCERLLAGGAPGLHFYTLNKAEQALKLLSALQRYHLVKSKPVPNKVVLMKK